MSDKDKFYKTANSAMIRILVAPDPAAKTILFKCFSNDKPQKTLDNKG